MAEAEQLSVRNRLLGVVQGTSHRAIVFHDLAQVPVGSVGYLSPSGRHVLRDEKGWLHDGRRFDPETGFGTTYTFTSQSGPANDAALVAALHNALVPEHGVLVRFGTKSDSESDWELGYSATWTDLADPQVLAHRLSDRELAELTSAIEQFGGLQEGDAYHQLDRKIEHLAEEPTARHRQKLQGITLGDLSVSRRREPNR